MGCDIHLVLEIKHKDKWVGIISDNQTDCCAGERWYVFFAELGMARRADADNAPDLKGIPDDASDLTQFEISTGCWDHSHSWLSLDEFTAAFERAHNRFSSEESKNHLKHLFGENFYPDSDSEYRVVFAFDN